MRHAADALGDYRAFHAAGRLGKLPALVVYPRSTEQVSKVVEWASTHGVPVVPYGGGTGVMGAAAAVEGCITVDLKRMDRMLRIDREARLAVAEAGALLGNVDDALRPHELMLGHDPWSQPIATVGGAISTDGVGYLAGKYGSMGDQVLGLEVVLPSGEVVQTQGVPKGTGPSLPRWFIGAEGILGIVTRATLQVFPVPERRSLHALRFPTFEAGFGAAMEMFSLGIRPALLDLAEEPPATADNGDVELYLGFDGLAEEVQAQEARALDLCFRSQGEKLPTEVAAEFWAARHRSAERYCKEVLEVPVSQRRRSRWSGDYLHVALPASQVLAYRHFAQQALQRHGVVVREWSIWGRPEFFSLMVVDPAPAEGSQQRMAAVVDELLVAAQDMGGAMEYCHGVGLKLAHLMPREKGPGLELLRRLKEALDPHGIMNPGKLGL
ncbi:MAG: FAD-binding oxidoreductase [Chloroflexi bacterium]|nr:FAD-binding oxidoreductase [Chloroflexota bacterium]